MAFLFGSAGLVTACHHTDTKSWDIHLISKTCESTCDEHTGGHSDQDSHCESSYCADQPITRAGLPIQPDNLLLVVVPAGIIADFHIPQLQLDADKISVYIQSPPPSPRRLSILRI